MKSMIFFFLTLHLVIKFLKNLDLIKNKMFNLNHIVIVHREAKMDDDFENYINIIFSKTYGRSKIIFGTFI